MREPQGDNISSSRLKTSFAIASLILLVFSISFPMIGFYHQICESNLIVSSRIDKSGYETHMAIDINSDSGFTEYNGVTEGSGTAQSPYIISGWVFDHSDVYSTPETAISISNTDSHFIIKDCLFIGDEYRFDGGINLQTVMNCKIESCVFYFNFLTIYGGIVENVMMADNEFFDCDVGAQISYSHNITFKNNFHTFRCDESEYWRGGDDGVSFFSCTNVSILGNSFENHGFGAYISNSIGSFVSGNRFTYCGIGIYGDKMEDYLDPVIDNTNLVNNKPILFYKNSKDINIPSNCGQVIMVNSSNMKINGLSIINTSVGVFVAYSNIIQVTNCHIFGCNYGIEFCYSNNLNVSDNNFESSRGHNWGANCRLEFCDNNVITNNIFKYARYHSILLNNSNNNSISSNNFYSSVYDGVGLEISNNNIFINNYFDRTEFMIDFQSNNNQIYNNDFYLSSAEDKSGKNQWSDEIQNGNYWSDYRYAYSPPAENDGLIWDTPYEIEGGKGAKDNKPLVHPLSKEVPYDWDPPKITIYPNQNLSHTRGSAILNIKFVDQSDIVYFRVTLDDSNNTILKETDEIDHRETRLTIDTTLYPDGPLSLTFFAMDKNENSNFTEIEMIIDNTPVELFSIKNQSIVAGDEIALNAKDYIGNDEEIEFKWEIFHNETYDYVYTPELNYSFNFSGNYSIRLIVWDLAANENQIEFFVNVSEPEKDEETEENNQSILNIAIIVSIIIVILISIIAIILILFSKKRLKGEETDRPLNDIDINNNKPENQNGKER